MEDKIEVGEYVRTKDGRIAQIKSIDYEAGIYRFDRIIHITDFRMKEDVLYSNEMFKKVIVKHRKQPIDLIEDKDIVEIELSEEFVEKKDKKKLIQIGDIYTKETLQKDIINGIITRILTILSYNQYMANCYKVEGGEEECM